MGSKSKSNQSSSSQNVANNQSANSGINMNYGVNQSGNFGQNQSNNFGFNQGSSQGSSSGSSSQQSTNSSSSSSNQNVWDAQKPFLEDVYGQAQDAFGSGMESVDQLTPEVQAQMQDSFQQAQGGFGNQMGGGFASGLQGQIGPNSYVDAMKGQIADDANTLKQQNLGNLDARAAAAGMSGSSGYRDQVARMQDSVDENAMNQMANIGFQAHDRGIANQMNLANMQDRNQQFGTQNLQNMQQGAMNQFNPAMVGMNMAGQYGNIIGGPTTLTNSSSSSMGQSSGSSRNSSNNVSNNFGMNTGSSSGTNMGFSNGMNMGMGMTGGTSFGNSLGSSTGQGSSSSTSIDPGFAAAGIGAIGGSDARLKENIEHVEQIDGINMYTWDWKDPEMSWPMNYGVIAQEVAETHPEAVMTGDHGYMMVDYSKLGRAGEAALSRMEG
jgi:hypothetical protein